MAQATSISSRVAQLFQRETSLLTNEQRQAPVQPLRRGSGIVTIGAVNVPVRHFTAEDMAEKDRQEREAWNNAKQASRQHTCAMAEMGSYCAHAV